MKGSLIRFNIELDLDMKHSLTEEESKSLKKYLSNKIESNLELLVSDLDLKNPPFLLKGYSTNIEVEAKTII